MDETISKVLTVLNLLNVHGKQNLDLLLYAIQQLESLQKNSGEVK